MNEVNVQPIDLGDELQQGVQPRLNLAPVVVRRPIARESLNRRERHSLRVVRDGLSLGHRVAATRRSCRERLVRKVNAERADGAEPPSTTVSGAASICVLVIFDSSCEKRDSCPALPSFPGFELASICV